ncbi:hypothetical protein JKP88DRAFT_262527 [Tribonema minus]|uniref:Uncharacterized protein n=1 Tax=Tribonema minus TaxID=303371 RepID=A0A835Z422_9STRA|nr:hypothetical protein JKP88DRAFT_262527 [Tribonema minus]
MAAGAPARQHHHRFSDSDENSDDGEPPPVYRSASPLRRPEGITDSAWKRLHSHYLLSRMLDLEQPIITDKMIEFLLQDGVCEIFVAFITQVPEEFEDQEHINEPPPADGAPNRADELPPRPEPGDELTYELKRSYRATMLLSSDQPSNALLSFLAKRARVITTSIFKVFWRSAKGSLHHACRVLDHLLRHQADQLTYPSAAGCSGMVGAGMRGNFNGATCAIPYQATPQSRWKMYSSLADWRFLLVLASHVYAAQYPDVRTVPAAQSTPAHASACADMLLEAVEVLSADENGELLLQPLAHCPELVNGLVDIALAAGADRTQRTDAARVLVGLIQKAAPDQIACQVMRPTGPQQAALIPNRLKSVRTLMHRLLRVRLADISRSVSAGYTPALFERRRSLGGAGRGEAGGAAAEAGDEGGGGVQEGSGAAQEGADEVEADAQSTVVADEQQSQDENAASGAANHQQGMNGSAQGGVCAAACDEGDRAEGAVLHPGYTVERPFTLLRYLLMSIIVEVVHLDSTQLDFLDENFWAAVCTWVIEYPHNTLFQCALYRLLVHALRCNSEGALRLALSRCKLVSTMAEAYVAEGGAAVNRGFILQLCNVIRLQADTLPPSAFLRNFLQGHERQVSRLLRATPCISHRSGPYINCSEFTCTCSWRTFLPVLRERTLAQQEVGMGFVVPMPSRQGQQQASRKLLRRVARALLRINAGPLTSDGLLRGPQHPTAAAAVRSGEAQNMLNYETPHTRHVQCNRRNCVCAPGAELRLRSTARAVTQQRRPSPTAVIGMARVPSRVGADPSCARPPSPAQNPQQIDEFRLGQLGADEAGGIDHGSSYARRLGFDSEIAWPSDGPSPSARKKKKKKKKASHVLRHLFEKKKSGSGGGMGAAAAAAAAGDASSTGSPSQGEGDGDSDDDESNELPVAACLPHDGRARLLQLVLFCCHACPDVAILSPAARCCAGSNAPGLHLKAMSAS